MHGDIPIKAIGSLRLCHACASTCGMLNAADSSEDHLVFVHDVNDGDHSDSKWDPKMTDSPLTDYEIDDSDFD